MQTSTVMPTDFSDMTNAQLDDYMQARGMRGRRGEQFTFGALRQIVLNPQITGDTLMRVIDAVEFMEWDKFVADKDLHPLRDEVYLFMAGSGEYAAQRAVWSVPGMSDDLQVKLSKDADSSSRANLASKTDSPVVLTRLSKDRSGYVASSVARNRHTPLDVMQFLAQSRDADVRRAVAEVTKDIDLMTVLSDDRDAVVVSALAGNAALPLGWQRKIAEYGHDGIWQALLRCKTTDVTVVNYIVDNLRDDDYTLQETAMRNARLSLDRKALIAARTRSTRVRRTLLAALSQDEMIALASSEDEKTRLMVSKGLVRVALR